jgi:hypothetical protein
MPCRRSQPTSTAAGTTPGIYLKLLEVLQVVGRQVAVLARGLAEGDPVNSV